MYLQQWREQQTLTANIDAELSEPFRQAVLAEFGRITNALKEGLTSQIESEKGKLKETQDLLLEQEAKIEELANTLADQQKTAAQSQLEFEKSLSAAQALVEDGIKREASLQKQMDAMRQELHASEVKAAVLENRCQAFEEQNQKLEQEVKTMKK